MNGPGNRRWQQPIILNATFTQEESQQLKLVKFGNFMQTTSLQSSVRVYAVLIHPNLTNVVDYFQLAWLYSTRSFSGINIEYIVLGI